ncbi:MAG TPA: superoxide dismutase family protein [Polyangiaceae bacterium]|nr:superoxide dismutase family protein [Polyangiaceae bacterium]
MRNGFARCLVLAGLAAPALFACSDDKPDDTGTAGSSSGGSAAGTQSGGSATAGTNTSAGTTSGGTTGTAGTGTAGTGTAGTGTAGTGTAGTATGGSGGSAAGGSAGSASGGGGAGGGSGMPTAVANITGLMGQTVTGTATFTQGATMTTLVLNLTACPNGAHASHLHAMKDCGDNGNAAGGHWVPNGEGLGDYTCADNKGMLTVTKPIATWTVGDGSATDVTKYSFMVHEMGGASPGGRIGCGLINKQ